ncbi:MAG: hypothetical protein ACRD4Y_07725 [Candidatus Acidiferrales bacterium]
MMRRKKEPAFPFIHDELFESILASRVRTHPMFGCHAVYIDEKIVFILRNKHEAKTLRDDGLWVAMMPEHRESLRLDYPALRPIEMFAARGREGFGGWLNLPASEDGFEETALALCRLVIQGDPRIGKIPKARGKRRRK